MRREMTLAEAKLWFQSLQNMPFRFRRQRPFGVYIVDFYCAKKKLAIEIDGESHFTLQAQEYDQKRTLYLENLGLKVIRFNNNDIMSNLSAVHEEIIRLLL